MGRDEFAQWLLIGESGIESVERKISQNGVNKLSRATIWKVLTALVELGVETNKSRMKAARDRIRVSGSKCEGQKRYGYFPEEKPVLAEMKRLRDRGLTFDNIAALLNEENIPSRKGGLWAGCTINKILKRDNSRIEEIEPKKKIEREKALDNMLRFSYKCTNEEN
jgi:DNA-binding transcriptional MerR regulator